MKKSKLCPKLVGEEVEGNKWSLSAILILQGIKKLALCCANQNVESMMRKNAYSIARIRKVTIRSSTKNEGKIYEV